MRRIAGIATLFVFVLATTPGPAWAAVTWHTGPNFSITDFDLQATGSVSGLGTKATAQLFATGTGSGTCANPAGKFPTPFSSVPIVASGSSTVNGEHSGASTVDVTVIATLGNPCPNPHWSVTFTSVTYTTGRIVISNKTGVLLDQTYALGSPCMATSDTSGNFSPCTSALE